MIKKEEIKQECFQLSNFSPKIIVINECSNYLIDMVAFTLSKSELKIAKKINKFVQKFIVIVAVKIGSLNCYSFPELYGVKYEKMYTIENPHRKNLLCIKPIIFPVWEQEKYKACLPYFFITGGSDRYIRIWEMISGDCIRVFKISTCCVDFLIIQESNKDLIFQTNSQQQDNSSKNLVIIVGDNNYLRIFDTEKEEMIEKQENPVSKYIINVIEPLGEWENPCNKKKFIRFVVGDKGNSVKIWKVFKKNSKVSLVCEKIIRVNILWILSVSSFYDPNISKESLL